jgi:hypothetical protein
MSDFIELTPEEKESLRRVHQAIRNHVQSGRLAEIRNEIIHRNDKHFGFIEAFDEILKVNKVYNIGNDNKAWTGLRRIAEKYGAEQAGADGQDSKEWKKRRTRVKQRLFISMQWPLEILTKYGWYTEKFSRDGLSYAYNCATMCPSFEDDFIPQVNLVNWLKHCSAVSALESAKEQDFAPKGEKDEKGEMIAVKDLKSLSELKYGQPVLIYDTEVTLETAGQLQHEIKRWTENQDGVVFVGGKRLDLKEHRPTHWNIYLLKFNENGLLVRRKISDRAATPRRDGILSPPTSMLAPADDHVRLQARSRSPIIPVSSNGAASDMGSSVPDSISGSVAGSVAGRAVVGSHDNTADSVPEIAAAGATCSAMARNQYDIDHHDIHDTPKARHSDADSTSSYGTGSSNVEGFETEPSKPDLACEASCVQRSARARRMKVPPVFLEDDCDEDRTNDQGPSNKPLDDEASQDADSDPEELSNGQLGDLSRAHDSLAQTPTSTGSMGKEHLDIQQEFTREPTQERDIRSHKTPMENEVIADHRGDVGASTDVLPGQVDEPYVIEDLSEVESWLIGQDNSLFVGDSPTNASRRRSEAPEATPSAQTRVPQETNEALRNGALPTDSVWTPANNRYRDASAYSDAIPFLPPATREPPKTSLVRTILPQPVATQDIETKSSMTAKKNSSDTTKSSSASESSSELASCRHTESSNVARTVQGLTPSSSERSSSRDDSPPSERSSSRDYSSPSKRSSSRDDSSPSAASLSNSDAGEAWPGCNARELSSPLKFTKMGHHSYTNLSIASDAFAAILPGKKAADYLSQMPPSVFAPYIPHASIERKGAQEEWGAGYGSLFSGLRGHLDDDDVKRSDYSDVTSRDSPDPPRTHFGPRPEDCTCDICDNIGPLLERVRVEASSNGASSSCRARGRWFGSAEWASAGEVSDMGESGQQSDHEVTYVDHASFREMTNKELPLDKPVVINGYQNGQGVYGVEAFQKALKDSYGNSMVTMSNATAHAPTQVGMEEFLTRFSDDEWSIGSCTPRGSFGTQPPAFLSYDRFRLLQSAVTRASCHPVETSGAGATCDNVAHSLCVNGGLSFNRIESSGAFSGPCLGSLGGTWLHVLQGRRLCAFIPRERLTASFRDDFVHNGLEWQPRNEQRLVLLEPDDVLVLPAGIVCAQLAVDAGVSFEGSFWDECDWGRYFTAAQWAAVNPTHVTAQIPRCATRLALHGLKSIAKDDPQRFASDRFAREFLATDRSRVFEEVVMAGRCSPGRITENCGTQGFNASGAAGRRRLSGAQAYDEQQRAKRMCIR